MCRYAQSPTFSYVFRVLFRGILGIVKFKILTGVEGLQHVYCFFRTLALLLRKGGQD